MRKILGIDPGLASTGYGVIQGEASKLQLLDYGVIQTQVTKDLGARLCKIYDYIQAIIAQWKPQEMCMEALFFSRNVSSAMAVANAKGVIALCATKASLPLAEYTPNIIKKAVTGTSRADKALVERFVKLLLGEKEEIKPDHASDALAVAIAHYNSTVGPLLGKMKTEAVL